MHGIGISAIIPVHYLYGCNIEPAPLVPTQLYCLQGASHMVPQKQPDRAFQVANYVFFKII